MLEFVSTQPDLILVSESNAKTSALVLKIITRVTFAALKNQVSVQKKEIDLFQLT